MTNILYNFKLFSIALFFLALTYAVIDLDHFAKAKLNHMDQLVTETKQETLQQVALLRTDTFDYLHTTNNQLDKRIGKLEFDLFKRVDNFQEWIDKITEDVDEINHKTSHLIDQYSTIPDHINTIASRLDKETDCTLNDLCWQNSVTDLLQDTRNTVRDGSKSYRLFNEQFPKMVSDFGKISDSSVVTSQKLSESLDHIAKITQPHWYDRLLTYGTSGAMLYFTATKKN